VEGVEKGMYEEGGVVVLGQIFRRGSILIWCLLGFWVGVGELIGS